MPQGSITLKLKEVEKELKDLIKGANGKQDVKKTIAEIMKDRNFCKLVIDYAPIGIMIIDKKGCIQECNKGVEDIFGQGHRQGINILRAKTIKNAALDKNIKKALSGKGSKVYDKEYESFISGKGLYITWIFQPLRLNNKIEGAMVLMLDSTGRKLAEQDLQVSLEKLKDLDKLKSDFIGILSHKMRSPLSIIRWNMEMLIQGDFGTLNADQMEALVPAYKNAVKTINIIEDLTFALDIEEEKVSFKKEVVDFNNIVIEKIEDLDKLAELRKIKIKFIKNNLPKVKVDRKKISEAIEKLLENAIRYNKDNGLITIKAEKEGKNIKFIITDTGIGIPVKDKRRVFDRFFRSSNVFKGDQLTSGVGLYIAKYVVEKHGGVIGFESEENKGTTFWFEIPIK